MSSSRLSLMTLLGVLAASPCPAEVPRSPLNLSLPAQSASDAPLPAAAYRARMHDEAELQQMLYSRAEADAGPNDLHNYLWLRQFDPDYDHWEGSYAAFKLVQTGFKRAWDMYRSRHLAEYRYIPDGEGYGAVGGFDYNLRVSNDKLRLQFEYAF